MKRNFALLFIIGVLNLLLFLGVFKLLQHDKIYQHTLGVISQNYERTGDWNNYEIKKVSKPYVQIKNENFENWDAAIYSCISKKMYAPENECYGKVRSAFFPLFPMLWKITNSSFIGISLINYFLFIISIALLVMMLFKEPISYKLGIYAILISIPSSIVFYIPYSESVFLFTMVIATIGVLKNKYWIYFVGILLFSMVRPASVFVLMAIIAAESMFFIKNRDWYNLLRRIAYGSIPFLLGYLFVFIIQFIYSGSWTTFFDAQKYWEGGFSLITNISDWSLESFGLTSFAMIFVCLPALSYIIYLLFAKNKLFPQKSNDLYVDFEKQHLLLVSLLYLSGIFVFTLITSGGNFHSFFRFTLGSPFFYIAILILLSHLFNNEIKPYLLSFIVSVLLLFIFMSVVKYGGERIQFSYFGPLMFILTSLFLLFRRRIPFPIQILTVLLIIFLNTVWNTYLLNIFLSNGWIFT
jgi:hypothetical protein